MPKARKLVLRLISFERRRFLRTMVFLMLYRGRRRASDIAGKSLTTTECRRYVYVVHVYT